MKKFKALKKFLKLKNNFDQRNKILEAISNDLSLQEYNQGLGMSLGKIWFLKMKKFKALKNIFEAETKF